MFTGAVSERPETLLLSAVIVKASLGAFGMGVKHCHPGNWQSPHAWEVLKRHADILLVTKLVVDVAVLG